MIKGLVIEGPGKIRIKNFPRTTQLPSGYVRVQTINSVASVGTELSMIRNSYQNRKDKTIPLGYSAAGIICETNCEKLAVSQRVAVYGAPYVWHSAELLVPNTLVVPVPDCLSTEVAATVGLGAIALHALRSAEVEMGQHVVIMGLGILGIILAKLAVAAGCFVYASEPLASRCKNITDERVITCKPSQLSKLVDDKTQGRGADAVFLMMGTASSEVLAEAVDLCRLRGIVSIVSDADAKLPRALMFQKEVRLIVPQAGGPGRYDPSYERDAIDYPYSDVRWTEGRNMESYINFLAKGYLTVADLLPRSIPLEKAAEAYALLDNEATDDLTIVFHYKKGN